MQSVFRMRFLNALFAMSFLVVFTIDMCLHQVFFILHSTHYVLINFLMLFVVASMVFYGLIDSFFSPCQRQIFFKQIGCVLLYVLMVSFMMLVIM